MPGAGGVGAARLLARGRALSETMDAKGGCGRKEEEGRRRRRVGKRRRRMKVPCPSVCRVGRPKSMTRTARLSLGDARVRSLGGIDQVGINACPSAANPTRHPSPSAKKADMSTRRRRCCVAGGTSRGICRSSWTWAQLVCPARIRSNEARPFPALLHAASASPYRSRRLSLA